MLNIEEPAFYNVGTGIRYNFRYFSVLLTVI